MSFQESDFKVFKVVETGFKTLKALFTEHDVSRARTLNLLVDSCLTLTFWSTFYVVFNK